MLTRRIIPCLDIRDRRVTKGVKFKNNIDLGDPVELATRYYEEGCDELVFYDITASAERRPIDIGMVRTLPTRSAFPLPSGEASPRWPTWAKSSWREPRKCR